MDKKIIVAITGASGSCYGIKALEYLRKTSIQTHLIISKSASLTLKVETGLSINDLKELADFYYNSNDIGAKIASGSFKTFGMIIAPCSIKTMSAIATGYTNDLISRAADVTLKERRTLILMLRETPLHLGHLENMTKLAQIGAIIAPPVPAFYNNPKTIDDIVTHSVGRALDLFGLDYPNINRWQGL